MNCILYLTVQFFFILNEFDIIQWINEGVMLEMKKGIISLIIIILAACGIILANEQSEQGLVADIKYHVLPDPMERNTYDTGQCTHYIFEKVKERGHMIESDWSDAEHWAENAEADEYVVNDQPETGAIMQTARGEIGHVAYIESVNSDGSIHISEMNLYEPHEVTERTIEAQNLNDYTYIHPKINPHAEYERIQDNA